VLAKIASLSGFPVEFFYRDDLDEPRARNCEFPILGENDVVSP
jgi:hypothetical protein